MAQHKIQGPEQSNRAEMRFGAVLAGRQYDMALVWNDRMKYWRFEMIGPNNDQLIDGIRVVANLDMLQPYNDARMPPGALVCHDTENLRQPPGRQDWLERHILVYVDPEDDPEAVQIRVTAVEMPN